MSLLKNTTAKLTTAMRILFQSSNVSLPISMITAKIIATEVMFTASRKSDITVDLLNTGIKGFNNFTKTKDGKKITLTRKEIMLLKLLIENKNEVVPREKILQAVWGYNVYPTTRTIDNFILSFRKYFEEDSRNPRYFHSVRGVGYKYSE